MLNTYVKNRRTELGYTRNKLATLSNVSHTEIQRIESGDRKQPSMKILRNLAEALKVPYSQLLVEAGYTSVMDMPVADLQYPGSFSAKQQEAVTKFIDGLSRNAELADEDIDQLNDQVEMFLEHVRKKNNSK